jgi:hypothetical protein
MAKQLILSVSVELPDDFFEANRVAMKLSDPWLVLCQALRDTGVKHETKTDELEVRAKPGRPRKPRIATVPAEAA